MNATATWGNVHKTSDTFPEYSTNVCLLVHPKGLRIYNIKAGKSCMRLFVYEDASLVIVISHA